METFSALLTVFKGIWWPLAFYPHKASVMHNFYVSFLACQNKLLNKIPEASKPRALGANVMPL